MRQPDATSRAVAPVRGAAIPNPLVRARLDSELFLPHPRDEVFAFFEDPRNLEAITPPSLRFHLLPPTPGVMRRGTLIAYVLRIRGVPVPWLTHIMEHDAPRRFVDRQLFGPYLSWVHTHTFEEEPEGTRVRDRVEYAHLGGASVERRLVRPDLERIFEYRREALRRRFGGP